MARAAARPLGFAGHTDVVQLDLGAMEIGAVRAYETRRFSAARRT
jgi:hypothetical protein